MKEEITKKETFEVNKLHRGLYCWGAFFGWVIGMIFSKVYILWAVWFYEEGSRISGITGWRSNSSPLWEIAYSHPQVFNLVTIIFSIIASLFFVRFLIKNYMIRSNTI